MILKLCTMKIVNEVKVKVTRHRLACVKLNNNAGLKLFEKCKNLYRIEDYS